MSNSKSICMADSSSAKRSASGAASESATMTSALLMEEDCHMVGAMDTPDTRTFIEEKLAKAFAPIVEIDVIDQSAAHAGHAGARESGGGHFQIILVAEAFDGLKLLERQRKVYDVLADEMKTSIHALSMTCLTPAEYEGDD